MSTGISWQTIQHITNGRLGRIMATCPLCSERRRTPQKRHNKVLAVNLLEPEFAVYYCNHCGEKGHCYPDSRRRVIDPIEQQRRRDEAKRRHETQKQERTRGALVLWDQGQPLHQSPAYRYLRDTRKIGDWLDTFSRLDEALRYHPNCPFGDKHLPCMLALVSDVKTDDRIAIHRTALTKDNPPQKIDRMSLGPVGGGAIKISSDDEVTHGLLIGEGIETVLAASRHYQFKPVWSLIDAGNLAKFPALSGIECVTIAVDNDAAGMRAAEQCAGRLVQAAIEVIATQTKSVNDFNDMITGAHDAAAR
jgi:putative DNA primase/helicase